MILTQFGQGSLHEYPMLATLAPTSSPLSRPVIAQVSVHYPGTEFEDLMTAVWKIPFEDSLSLVAKITPDGSAKIGDVLEYPKSPDLLEAVELTLSGGQFQTVRAQNLDDTFVPFPSSACRNQHKRCFGSESGSGLSAIGKRGFWSLVIFCVPAGGTWIAESCGRS